MTLSVPARWLANPNCESQALVATCVHSTKARKSSVRQPDNSRRILLDTTLDDSIRATSHCRDNGFFPPEHLYCLMRSGVLDVL